MGRRGNPDSGEDHAAMMIMGKYVSLLRFFDMTRMLGHECPLIASFKLTYRCNLSCRACPFHLLSVRSDTHMDWDTACRSLDTLSEMGCPIVVFEGGEPLDWSDGNHTFYDLVNYAREKFFSVAATTNGTLNLDCTTDILWVSVDGLRDTHNHLRNNSYDLVIENVKAAKHPKLFIHITLNSLNYKECADIVRAVSSIPTVKGITLQLFYPYGQGEELLALTGEERKLTLNEVLTLKKEGYPILNSSWGLNAMIDNSWACREKLLANVSPDGRIVLGCYVKDRGEVVCSQCGFTPVAEASGAYSLLPGPLMAGVKIFLMG
jgi:MoaA/NifB/PqqE/SkfB family radical SAM enzyme